MQDRLEAGSRAVVGEDQLSQPGAIEPPVGVAIRRSEFGEDRHMAGLPAIGQAMGQAVGVCHVDAQRRERIGNSGFSAADTAGEADDEGHGR